MPSMVTLLRQRRLRWHGHVSRMEDGRIPKDLLYAELAEGKRATGRLQLRFKDVCKRDLKAIDVEVGNWENLAQHRSSWRGTLHTGINAAEGKLRLIAEAKRAAKKSKEHRLPLTNSNGPAFKCQRCDRAFLPRIGLHRHSSFCRAGQIEGAQI